MGANSFDFYSELPSLTPTQVEDGIYTTQNDSRHPYHHITNGTNDQNNHDKAGLKAAEISIPGSCAGQGQIPYRGPIVMNGAVSTRPQATSEARRGRKPARHASFVPGQASHVPWQNFQVPSQTPFAPEQAPYIPMQTPYVPRQDLQAPRQTSNTSGQNPYAQGQGTYAPVQASYVPMQAPYAQPENSISAMAGKIWAPNNFRASMISDPTEEEAIAGEYLRNIGSWDRDIRYYRPFWVSLASSVYFLPSSRVHHIRFLKPNTSHTQVSSLDS
ncbi:MAG: hypothetical protein Q9204_001885 [Flavoplaca sp. TL-2023a]